MQITEPTTMLTDYALSISAAIFALRLFRMNDAQSQKSIRLWGGALGATAIAAFIGGTSHGFALHFSDFARTVIWKGTVYSVGLASFFMLAGTLFAAVGNPLRKWVLGLVLLKFLVYAGWMVSHDDFNYVIFDYAPAMLGVVLLQLYCYSKWKHKSAVWLISGVVVSFAGAGVQISGFTIHKHFNYNDLYHVIQMGGIYLLYRGACLLEDQ